MSRSGAARIAIVDQRANVLQIRAEALSDAGYDTVHMISTASGLGALMKSNQIDLIVGHAECEGVFGYVKDIRHEKVGDNPFVVVLMSCPSSQDLTIKQAINAGVDDVIIETEDQVQARKLLERVSVLASYRRRFIVTADYIGPDRRRDPARASTIPLTLVPNPLDAASEEDRQREVERARVAISEEKLRRMGFQISFLVNLVMDAIENGTVTPDSLMHAKRLVVMAREAGDKLEEFGNPGVLQLCRSLQLVGASVSRKLAEAPEKDLKLMRPISTAILMALFPAEGEEALATQIADTVEQYKTRQAKSAA